MSDTYDHTDLSAGLDKEEASVNAEETETDEEDKDEVSPLPPKKSHTARNVGIGIAAVAVIAALGFGVYQCSGNQNSVTSGETSQEQTSEDAEEAQLVTVTLNLQADGFGDGSSPFLAHITGETLLGETVDYWHAIWPDGSTSTLELEPGSYEIAYVSAIGSDGSIWRTGDAVKLDVSEGSSETTSDATFEHVSADKVTQDDLDAILNGMNEAIQAGDETLTGDAGTKVVDTATGNAAKNPNADKDKVESAKDNAQQTVDKVTNEGSSASKPSGGSSSSSSSSKPSGGNSSNSGSSSSKPSGGSSSSNQGNNNSGSSSSQPQKTWVEEQGHYEPIYEEQPVYEDRPVYTTVTKYGCTACGAIFDSNSAYTEHAWSAHNGETSYVNYDEQVQTGTERVQTGTKKVQTGQKWVVDVPGHWE